MKRLIGVLFFCVAMNSILIGDVRAEGCSCIDMSSTACRRWGSSGTGFHWITGSNPSSSITLTSGPCGGSGESGTAYIYAYLNASSQQCDNDYTTPCGSDNTSYGRYAKIKVTGNQKAFQHIFPDGLSFRGNYIYWGEHPHYSSVSITETNTECDLKLADTSQVLRIVLNASVAQCDSSFSGSKFNIQIKFYEARNSGLTQFSMLDTVNGSLTVDNNPKTSFDPENFIPDVREGTANGWIEKTTYDLSNETTDNRWLIEYRQAGEWNGCETATTGLAQTSTSAPGTLIPSSHTVYRIKVPGFKRSMHGLAGYAAQSGWSYKWDTNETYIQYKSEGKEIRFYCESPADNGETNRRYLIRRVECISGGQQPDTQWYVNYTYNSPAKIANIHNGSDPNDPNTVNSATIQYVYDWNGNTVDVSYRTRPTTVGTWQTERQWQAEFDDEGRAVKYDAGCSSGCSGSGEFENVTYLDPAQYDLTGYEYLIQEQKDSTGTIILQNSYQEIDFGEWVPAYWLYLTNTSFESPDISGCVDQTQYDDIQGWIIDNPTQQPYSQICDTEYSHGSQSIRPNGHIVYKEFDGYLSASTQYQLSVSIRADIDAQHTSQGLIEIYYDDGSQYVLLEAIDVDEIGTGELTEGQWEDFSVDVECPAAVLALPDQTYETTFMVSVAGEYVHIDDLQLSGSIWVLGNSKPVVIEQKIYDDSTQSLKTAMSRSFDQENYIVTETRYTTPSEYRTTKYYYTDRTFSELSQKDEYGSLSETDPNQVYTTTYGGDDPNSIFVTTYPNGKRADYQIYDDSGNIKESYIVNLDNDVNSLREVYTYIDISGGGQEEWRIQTHTNARGGITEYEYDTTYISPNYVALLETQTDPDAPAGQQITSYTYDDAYRVVTETRKLDGQRDLRTHYSYNPETGFLDSMTVNGVTTFYKHNAFGQVIRQTNPDDVDTGKSYGLGGELVSEFMIHESSDPNNADTSLTLVSQTRYTYTADGQIGLIGKYKSDVPFTYQSDMTTNPGNWIVTKYVYYKNGKKKKIIEDYGTDRTNLTTQYFYNLQGEIEKVLYPTGKWVKTYRDGRGLIILEETGYGSDSVVLETAYSYDANGNLQQQSNPDGSILIYTYDNYDRLKRTYQGSLSGPYTERFYNNAGDVVRQIACEADGTVLSDSRMTYDVLGNLQSERLCAEPNSLSGTDDLVTHYLYDIAGNLRFEIRAGLENADPNENPDPNDIITEYVYDRHGRRTQTIDPKGYFHSVFYTAAGLPKIIVDPNDPQDPNAFITENIYDAYGRLEKSIDPMGHYVVNSYNSVNQITKQIHYDSRDYYDPDDDIPIRQIRTVYDNLGNMTQQAIMADPNQSNDIVLGTDLVTDYVYEPNGLLFQQKMYVGSTAVVAQTTYGYDEIGRRILTRDSEDNWEKIYYNTDKSLGTQVVKVEQFENDPDGSDDYIIRTFMLYDNDGRLDSRILDENGDNDIDTTDPKTSFTYDGLGRVTHTTTPDDIVTFTAYDGFGNVSQTIEDYGTGAENRKTEVVYNRLNQQYQIKAYDPNDTTAHVAIQTTTYKYDKNGNTTKIIYPDNQYVEYSYNLLNKPDIETKRDGSKIYYGYWWSGDLWYESDVPDGPDSTITPGFVTVFEYDGAGQLASAYKMNDGLEVAESVFTYNGFGARTSETAQYDSDITKTTYWTYDGSGNMLTQSHGDTTLTYTYDGLGRINTIDKGNDEIVAYTYLGRNTDSIDYPQADTTQFYAYDLLGRIIGCESVDGDSLPILDFEYTYDLVGNRKQCKYNHLSTVVYDKYYYDTLNRLWKVEYGQSTPFSYLTEEQEWSMDDMVLLASSWIENESTTYTEYAHKNRCRSIEEPSSANNPDVLLSQRLDLMEEILKEAGYRNRHAFLNTVKSIEQIAYDPDAPIYTLAEFGDDVPNNYTTETVYNDDNEVIAQIIWDNKARMVLFAMYPPDGTTVVVSAEYDNQGNETSKTFTTFDADGNAIYTEDMLAAEYNLTTESMSTTSTMSLATGSITMSGSAEAMQAKTDEFGYDHLGNRTTVFYDSGAMAQEMLEYSHNMVNQYNGYESSFLNGSVTSSYSYAHDDNGNLSTDENGNSYDYDYRNRLIKVQDSSYATQGEYVFDALGRRIYKNVDSITTYFFYDPAGRVIAEYEDAATPVLKKEYVFGNGFNEVLAMFTPYHAGDPNDWYAFVEFVEAWLCEDPNDTCYDSTYDYDNDDIVNFEDYAYFAGVWDIPSSKESDWYYIHDALGSVRALVGGRFQRESDREFYNYDVYGNLSIQNEEESKSGNPYLFAGYRYDAEIGLYHTKHRTYDPETGRWLQFDPIGYADSMSLFEYVMSNPTNFTDPWGLYGNKWYEKLWEDTKDAAVFIGASIYYLPSAYWETGTSGEQISSWCGCVDTMTDTLNPIGGGTNMGAQYGQEKAYKQGQQVGFAGGLTMNAVVMVAGVQGTVVGIQQMMSSGGCLLQLAQIETTAGTVVNVIVANGQATVATAETMASLGVVAATSKNMKDAAQQQCNNQCDSRQQQPGKPQKPSKEELKQLRREFNNKTKPEYWKNEAAKNPQKYTPENLQRMKQGKPPIGSDGHPIELHHKTPLSEGGRNTFDNLDQMTRTDHRLRPNYKKNHP